ALPNDGATLAHRLRDGVGGRVKHVRGLDLVALAGQGQTITRHHGRRVLRLREDAADVAGLLRQEGPRTERSSGNAECDTDGGTAPERLRGALESRHQFLLQ